MNENPEKEDKNREQDISLVRLEERLTHLEGLNKGLYAVVSKLRDRLKKINGCLPYLKKRLEAIEKSAANMPIIFEQFKAHIRQDWIKYVLLVILWLSVILLNMGRIVKEVLGRG